MDSTASPLSSLADIHVTKATPIHNINGTQVSKCHMEAQKFRACLIEFFPISVRRGINNNYQPYMYI